MESLSTDNILYGSVLFMKFIGENQCDTSRKLAVFRVLNCATLLFAIYFVSKNFLTINGEVFIKTLQSFIMFSHILLKYIHLMYHKPSLQILFAASITEFWNYRNFNRTIRSAAERYFKMVQFCQIIEPSATFAIVCLFFLRPAFNVTYPFPMYTAVPQSLLLDTVLAACHFYSIGIGILVIAICDLTYLALCVHMVVQTRLLKSQIRCLLRRSGENVGSEIKRCICYHQFLLTMFSQMQKIYSTLFLLHYFVTIFTTCSNLFVLARNANLTTNTTEFLCIIFLVLQFACYTFLADQVAFELSNISDAIYESKWYDKDSFIQNLFRIVMLKSQRTRYFSAAGLMDINMDTFAMMIKKTFSFYAIIRNVLNKD